MASRYTLPHIDIAAFKSSQDYTGSGSPNKSAVRIRDEHGRRLLKELEAAFHAIDAERPTDDRIGRIETSILEIDLRRGTKADILERKNDGVRPGAVKLNDANDRTVALVVPDHARGILTKILDDYLNGPLSEISKDPPYKKPVEAIEGIRRARLETLWTDDPVALPQHGTDEIWWAVWSWRDRENDVETLCAKLGLRIATVDRRLYFPEMVVIPVLASRAAIELMVFTSSIAELRRASDTPVFFVDDVRGDQNAWADDLAERITWPGPEVPAVCLLDTGANRSHALLEPALSEKDAQAVVKEWNGDDHSPYGHGTGMAGLALHGDLTARLADKAEPVLTHRIESVKILPPKGFDKNDPQGYGVLTQAAISLPVISAPDRQRVYCLATTNDGVSGAIASTWSAAIDQIACATMIGDSEASPKRLMVVSGGNIPPEVDIQRVMNPDECPIEDPAQAWNALTVGGYSDLIEIKDDGYADWKPFSRPGELSPHSRTSVTWPKGSPFKPEIVMEAGNRAISPSGKEILTLNSLTLLTTGHDADKLPLVGFDGTSAATAQAARLCAQLMAAHPEFWPETIRALVIHSADWTAPMQAEYEKQDGKRDVYALLRRYGYGVPSFERASASAKNDLALFAQTDIQPFRLKGTRKFNECHYYNLPIPAALLLALENTPIELKLTLSYFIDPNPGLSANVDPQRYQSFGLRFDLRRKGEKIDVFKKRVNASEREGEKADKVVPDDNRWRFGPQSISAGSVHSDVWTGPAIELLDRDILCIKPVVGWWRERAKKEIVNRKSRYALIVSLRTPDVEIDLHTPIVQTIEQQIPAETTIGIA